MIKAIAVDKPPLNYVPVLQLIQDIDKLNADILKLDYSIKLSERVENKLLNQNIGEQNNE